AEDVDPLGQGPEDLLVPDRGDPAEVAVDDRDPPGPLAGGAVDVSLGGRGEVDGVVEDRPPLLHRQGGAGEDENPGLAHSGPGAGVPGLAAGTAAAKARGPGR